MWNYQQARDYLVSALRREADAQDQGRPEMVGAAFDEFDANLPRDSIKSRFMCRRRSVRLWVHAATGSESPSGSRDAFHS